MAIELLQGDCRTLLPTLQPNSVQTVITSPPYWGLRDYGVDGQIGLEATIAEYITTLVQVFDLVWDVLSDDGTLWINMGDAYANDTKWGGQTSGKHVRALHGDSGIGRRRHQTGLPSKSLMGLPWRLALALQDSGWILRSEIIWHKPNVMPESVTDRPTRAHEHLFLLAKSEQYYYDQDAIREPQTGNTHPRGRGVTPKTVSGHHEAIKANESFHRSTSAYTEVPGGRNRRTVWLIHTQPTPYAHYATFPEKLVELCLLAGSRIGDTVLDPFAGTFTVGRVALRYGRQAIGIELSPAYADLADDRTNGVQVHMEAYL